MENFFKNITNLFSDQKTLTSIKSSENLKVNCDRVDVDKKTSSQKVIHQHPAAKFIHAKKLIGSQLKQYISDLYKGLRYSTTNLRGPTEEYVNRKKTTLAEPRENTHKNKKMLLLDLDETLIHSVSLSSNVEADVKFTANNMVFKFNIRPHCLQFLDYISQYYNVYVFTASTIQYAQPIVDHLNSKKTTILDILHRKNCMTTKNGLFIKDLRIISNRDLKDIVLVDNLTTSFGLQLENGVPIVEFENNKKDKELIEISKYLVKLSAAEDVREYNKTHLSFHTLLSLEETELLALVKARSSKN